MSGIDSWSTTAATNALTDGGSTSWQEGMVPSLVNNSVRSDKADIRAAFNDLAWFNYGSGDQGAGNVAVPSVYASATSFTITGSDVHLIYETGRRVRAVGTLTGTINGSISSSSYNSGNSTTTVNVTWDNGASLSNETLVISLSQIPVTGYAFHGYFRETSAAFSVQAIFTSSVTATANRTLTIDTTNGNRVLKMTGNAVLNQDVSTAGNPTFASLAAPTIGNGGNGIQATNGLYSGTFTQNAAVSGTFYTAIPYATLSPATGLSLWFVMVCCENVAAGVFVLTSPTTASPGITATQLAAGTNISAQIDGSGNFQVKQTNGSNQTLQAIWFRVGQ